MCNQDRANFLEEIEAVKVTMRRMEQPVDLTEMEPMSDDFKNQIENYTGEVSTASAMNGDMTASETATCTMKMTSLDAHVVHLRE